MYALEVKKSTPETLERIFEHLRKRNAGFWDTLFQSKKDSSEEYFRFLRRRRKEDLIQFYTKSWTVDEIQDELRLIAKEIELRQFYNSYPNTLTYYYGTTEGARRDREEKDLYRDAVKLELVDSEGDLERKADFLLRKLMKEDFIEFSITIEPRKLAEIGLKIHLGKLISDLIKEMTGGTIEDVARKIQEYSESEERLVERYPAAGEIIRNLVENERMKLAR